MSQQELMYKTTMSNGPWNPTRRCDTTHISRLWPAVKLTLSSVVYNDSSFPANGYDTSYHRSR